MALAIPGGIWAMGERVTGLSGLVLMLSSFMGWYAGSDEGPTIAVIGWHTGVIGKLVFLLGLAVVVLVVLRELGIELPATVPESLVIIVIGALATILVLIRLISVPDHVLPERRPRHRDLDRPHCGAGADRRRASTSRRRAVAVARPRSAPPIASSG